MASDRYTPVQHRRDSDTAEFILRGHPKVDHIAVMGQIPGRSTGDIVTYTLLAKVAATKKWQPFLNEAAGDGTAIPQGIYVGPDILEADIIAGDVTGLHVMLRDAEFRADWLVIEGGKTLDTIISNAPDIRAVEDYLTNLNLFARDVESRTKDENS